MRRIYRIERGKREVNKGEGRVYYPRLPREPEKYGIHAHKPMHIQQEKKCVRCRHMSQRLACNMQTASSASSLFLSFSVNFSRKTRAKENCCAPLRDRWAFSFGHPPRGNRERSRDPPPPPPPQKKKTNENKATQRRALLYINHRPSDVPHGGPHTQPPELSAPLSNKAEKKKNRRKP